MQRSTKLSLSNLITHDVPASGSLENMTKADNPSPEVKDVKGSSDLKHSYSCKRCRRLKKKCSRTTPECQNCYKAGESCEYVPRAPRRKKSEILKSLNEQQRASGMASTSPNSEEITINIKTGTSNNIGYGTKNGNTDMFTTLPAISSHIMSGHSLNTPRSMTNGINGSHKVSLPPLSSFRDINPLSNSSSTSSPPSLVPKKQQPTISPAADIQKALLRSTLGDGKPTWRPERVDSLKLNKERARQYIEQFFQDQNNHFPFVNKIELQKKFSLDDLRNIDSADPKITFEFYIVLLIGYSSLERHGKILEDAEIHRYLVYKSLEQASNIIVSDDYQSVKNLLLLGVYSLYESKGDISLIIAGTVVKLALSLGLNKKFVPRFMSEVLAEEQIEMRYRLFWSIYCFDRTVCVTLGQPYGLEDDDINTPFPSALKGEDQDSMEMVKSVINLRRIEGRVLKLVHTAGCGKGFEDEESKSELLKALRLEVEGWYNTTSLVTCTDKKLSLAKCTVSWYTASYYNLLMMLCRPSFLTPEPAMDGLLLVGKCTLQCLTYTYNLHTVHPLPLTWVHLCRFFTMCRTIVFCLKKSCIDLIETKTEINLCMEILEYFEEKWLVARQVLDVFRKINKCIYDIRVTKSWKLKDPDIISRTFAEASDEYHRIMESEGLQPTYDSPVVALSKTT